MSKPVSTAAKRRERWRRTQEKAGLCQLSVWVPEEHREAVKEFAKALSTSHLNAADQPIRKSARYAFKKAFPEEFQPKSS